MDLNKATCQVFRIDLKFRLVGGFLQQLACESDSEEPTKAEGDMSGKNRLCWGKSQDRQVPMLWASWYKHLDTWGPVHEYRDAPKMPAGVAELWGRLNTDKENKDVNAVFATVAWPLLCAWRFSWEEALTLATRTGGWKMNSD